MKNITLIIALMSMLILTGCKSKPEPPPLPQEYTQVPLYMAGQEIPGDDQGKYLSNASVKMYSVGRLVDPGTGTMREAGTVYRIETAPQWNLIPQYDANPESFARNQLQEQYANPLVGQMNRSMSEARDVKHGLEAVRQDIRGVEQKHQQLAAENGELKSELKKQNENTLKLLDSMKKMQRYIEILEQKVNDRNTMNLGDKK